MFNAHYGPHNVVSESLKADYPLFINEVRQMKGSTPSIMVLLISNSAQQPMFPNLAKVAVIGLLLPMSTADCERGFHPFSESKQTYAIDSAIEA